MANIYIYIYIHLNPILPIFYRETLNIVYVFGVRGHARMQLLGDAPTDGDNSSLSGDD